MDADDTGTVDELLEELRPHPPERLAEREAAVYARARADTVRDLADELARFAPRPGSLDGDDEGFRSGYSHAEQIVTTLRDRIARLGPAPELPPAPCLLQGASCPFEAGHAGACGPADYAAPAPDPAPRPARRPSPALRRAIVAGLIGALEEIGGARE